MELSQSVVLKRDDMEQFVQTLLNKLTAVSSERACVIALQGDLGAGKTTLVQILGKLLGVGESITSPTFTIMKKYETQNKQWESLVHMDAYRIDDLNELGPLNFAELLEQPHTLLCIEWAEKIAPALPPERITIAIEIESDEKRRIQVTHF